MIRSIWPGGRIRGPLAFFGLITLAVIGSHELIIGSDLQRSGIHDAVPGFSCRDLAVKPSSGSWSGAGHVMRSTLRMPDACLTNLKRLIRLDPRFHAGRCNAVQLCWSRSEGTTDYTFTFYDGYTTFRYARN